MTDDVDIFSLMLNLTDNDDLYNKEMTELEKQVTNIGTTLNIEPVIPYQMPVAYVHDFDEKFDLLDLNVREEFVNGAIFGNDLELFTMPILTTSTVQGNFTNVNFDKETIIDYLTADEEIVACKCNFGKIFFHGYETPVKVKKTNRGRKKKEKKVKMRKPQGTGDEMNSQVTFIVKSTKVEMVDGKLPPDAKVYKFKVFRTGKIQLPGVKPADTNDVIDCAKIIADELDIVLHKTDGKKTMLANLNPVMRNYKFTIKLKPLHIMILPELKKVMIAMEQEYKDKPDSQPRHPTFTFSKCASDDMAILFNTPIPTKPKKKLRFVIYMGGKVNILGGLDPAVDKEICTYMHYVINTNIDKVSGLKGD